MKILITGANGYIGSALTKYLAADGEHHVVAQSRIRINSLMPSVVSVVTGHIDSNTDWQKALHGIDAIVHTAARVHVQEQDSPAALAYFFAVNRDGSLNLARQAAQAGVRRLVFISSIGVNGSHTEAGKPFRESDLPQPHNNYALSKLEAERGLLRIGVETGLEVVILRPPLVYGAQAPGNFGTLCRLLKRGHPVPFGSIVNLRSLVALDNLLHFIALCMVHPSAANQVFLVADGHDLSTCQLVAGLGQVLGQPARLVRVPVWILIAAGKLTGQSASIESLCSNLQVDITRARALLGWQPPLTVAEGLRRAVGAGVT